MTVFSNLCNKFNDQKEEKSPPSFKDLEVIIISILLTLTKSMQGFMQKYP